MAAIYKITNLVNNKIYIGQTINSIDKRFKQHLSQVNCANICSALYSAFTKYGKENFIIEEIDTANTQEELNEKEQYWIKYYNSVIDGYNETDAISKCGGNTYQSKTDEEMEVIKDKIRQTKIGNKNPMAKKIKRINIFTYEIDIFDTVISCAKACGIQSGKTSITNRLNRKIKSPFKNTWKFEYYDE